MREHPVDAYKRWWVGKYCRRAGSHGPFRFVKEIEFLGPPSAVYGEVKLIYSDGAEEWVQIPFRGVREPSYFRPRKKDVEVWPHDTPPPEVER